jgi:hypothetical protein
LLATDTDVWPDDTWPINSTPIECGRSRTTTQRSNLAGWAGYGYSSAPPAPTRPAAAAHLSCDASDRSSNR